MRIASGSLTLVTVALGFGVAIANPTRPCLIATEDSDCCKNHVRIATALGQMAPDCFQCEAGYQCCDLIVNSPGPYPGVAPAPTGVAGLDGYTYSAPDWNSCEWRDVICSQTGCLFLSTTVRYNCVSLEPKGQPCEG